MKKKTKPNIKFKDLVLAHRRIKENVLVLVFLQSEQLSSLVQLNRLNRIKHPKHPKYSQFTIQTHDGSTD